VSTERNEREAMRGRHACTNRERVRGKHVLEPCSALTTELGTLLVRLPSDDACEWRNVGGAHAVTDVPRPTPPAADEVVRASAQAGGTASV
jgi:hypothetical protein